MTNEELSKIAKELDQAELNNEIIPLKRINSTIISKEDGYKIAAIRSKSNLETPKVWKLAGNDICGSLRLENTMIYPEGEGKLTAKPTHAYQTEVEISLKTKIDISADMIAKGLSNNELFASLHLAMEMPAFRIPTPITKETQGWLIADNAGAGSFAVGKALPMSLIESQSTKELENQDFKLHLDGELVSEGNPSTLWDNSINIARDILPYIIQQCGTLPKGGYITTGGIIGGTPIDNSSIIIAEWVGVDTLTMSNTPIS